MDILGRGNCRSGSRLGDLEGGTASQIVPTAKWRFIQGEWGEIPILKDIQIGEDIHEIM